MGSTDGKNEIVSDGLCALTAWGIPLLMSDRLIAARTSGSIGKYMDIMINEKI